MKQVCLIAFFLLSLLSGFAQTPSEISKDYFSPPMKIPFLLSGNFAELRPNHFHGGIDIKTQGRTGLPVYAAADGFVSRISVSPSGYGKAIYINHSNGTTTVYGHLNNFAPAIEKYLRKLQYEKETFAIDHTLPIDSLKVFKGEEIAKCGNSGSSAGPHLHFEIRQTKEQIMHNPLLFNMPVKDKTKPVVQSVMVYPLGDEACVSGRQQPQRFETILAGNAYKLKNNQPIQVWGRIGFGIQAIDLLDGSANHCGIYSLKLSVDNELIYSFSMDQYHLEESKYINSLIDYEQAIRSKRRLYRTYIEPGNKLSIYDVTEKRGIFKATDGKSHLVKFEITDTYGNATSLAFTVQSREISLSRPEPPGEHFRFNHNNHISEDDIEFRIPEGALYDDVWFQFERKPASKKFYSPVYQLHQPTVPLHYACPLRIKAENLPEKLQSKVMLAQVDPATGNIFSATGKYVDGWVEGNIRTLGFYALAVDTVAPKITPLSISERKTLTESNRIRFTITDNLSGIDLIRGTIDGKWVLFEYDLKNKLITYTFDKDRFQFKKNHELILEVADFMDNKSTYKANFYK